MKKLISTLIAAILIFSVSACKPEPAKEDNDKIKGSLSGNTQQELSLIHI